MVFKIKQLFHYLSEDEKITISENLLDCGSRLIGSLSVDMVGIPLIRSVEPVPFVKFFFSYVYDH